MQKRFAGETGRGRDSGPRRRRAADRQAGGAPPPAPPAQRPRASARVRGASREKPSPASRPCHARRALSGASAGTERGAPPLRAAPARGPAPTSAGARPPGSVATGPGAGAPVSTARKLPGGGDPADCPALERLAAPSSGERGTRLTVLRARDPAAQAPGPLTGCDSPHSGKRRSAGCADCTVGPKHSVLKVGDPSP